MTSEHVICGDVVALIKGSQVPFVLRRRTSGTYQLISEAYVDGIMDGEAAACSNPFVLTCPALPRFPENSFPACAEKLKST